MKEILKRYFSYQFHHETNIAGYKAYQELDGWVLVFPADYVDENYIAEQQVIANFLQDSGFTNVTTPINSNSGTYIVPIDGEYSVYLCHVKSLSSGKHHQDLNSFLKEFHYAGHRFPYTPVYSNRYGQWKTNWEQIVDQMDFLRQSLMEKATITNWERLWIESCFYFIGMGENAIQFLQESESKNYNQFDQPVFTFERINPLPHNNVIVANRIVHDHPSRDIAEWIRHTILKEGRNGISVISNFLHQYEQERNFSLFGWRLLFARLLFPIHFTDYTDMVLRTDGGTDINYKDFKDFLSYQAEYEYCLKALFRERDQYGQEKLPEVEWIYN
ncbi:spore coat protein YutH [Salirhabdus euzebyi]|uniref:Spore coat protein YutH n=1 Tax=Salirhabdus euzebyi TaxID=394506 RepID=A0A841Q4X2_9BACI|nr:hypothetical protein [Salirhabdus euzebyi]MBB6453438.1 spore coat protein YutH [Salirhabdus euzebyi]